MKHSEFSFQIDRLKSCFGDKNYSTDRLAMLWKETQHLDASWLEKTVDEFIGACRYAPLLTEFRTAISIEREKNQSVDRSKKSDQEWLKEYACDYCFDNGVYLAHKKDVSGVWAFRCHCPTGERDARKQIPQFKPLHKEQGFYYSNLSEPRTRAETDIIW